MEAPVNPYVLGLEPLRVVVRLPLESEPWLPLRALHATTVSGIGGNSVVVASVVSPIARSSLQWSGTHGDRAEEAVVVRRKKRARKEEPRKESQSVDYWIERGDAGGLARQLSTLEDEQDEVRAVEYLCERLQTDLVCSTREALIVVSCILERMVRPESSRLLLTNPNLEAVVTSSCRGAYNSELLARLVRQEMLDETLLLRLAATMAEEVLVAIYQRHVQLRENLVDNVMQARQYRTLVAFVTLEEEGASRDAFCASLASKSLDLIDTAIEMGCVDLMRAVARANCPLDILGRIPLPQCRQAFLQACLVSLKDSSGKVRLKALRALLCASPEIRSDENRELVLALQTRFLDQRMQVREAVVDLLGRMEPMRFFTQIAERSLDVSVSVRKRAVRILAQSGSVEALQVLIARLLDAEKSVRKLARDAFQRAWFGHSSTVAPESIAIQWCKIGGPWLPTLLSRFIRKAATPKDADCVRRVCQQVVEILLGAEQDRSISVAALGWMAEVVPAHVASHLEALRQLLPEATPILELVLGLTSQHEFTLLKLVEVDLVKIIYAHHDVAIVASAVRALVRSVTMTKHTRLLDELFAKLYAYVSNVMEASKGNAKSSVEGPIEQSLSRALFTLGHICRWYAFDTNDVPTSLHTIQAGRVHERVLRLALHYGDEFTASPILRARAVEAMGLLCVGRPRFLVLCNNAIGISLKASVPEVVLQVLGGLLCFLQEERRLNEARAAFEEDIESPAAAVLNYHLPLILSWMTTHSDPGIRSAALSLVCEALDQGIVQGIQCVPSLMAMACDDPVRGEMALRALVNRAAKSKLFASQLVSRIGVGLRAAWNMALKISPDDPSSRAAHVLPLLYRHFRDTVKMRTSFLEELMKCWDVGGVEEKSLDLVPGDDDDDDDGAQVDKPRDPFLLFLAHAMAWLPLNCESSPLMICYHVNRLLAMGNLPRSTASLLKQLKSFYKTTYKLSSVRVETFLPHKSSMEAQPCDHVVIAPPKFK